MEKNIEKFPVNQIENNKEINLEEIITRSKKNAKEAVMALEKLNINVAERHNVLIPGTPTTPQKSINLLRQAIKEKYKVSVYNGITVCPYICKFCRYYNKTSSDPDKLHKLIEENLNSMIQEMEIINKQLLGQNKIEASSIYIGGGTPTLMSEEQIKKLFSAYNKYYKINDSTEITMECTPDTINKDKLSLLKNLGVNRISMGVQRLNNQWLKEMGRRHSVSDVLNTLELLRDAKIHFNVDLIYGFKNQTIEDFCNDLIKIIQYEPSEITLYRFEDQKRTDDKNINIARADRENIYVMQETGREILTQIDYREGPDGWFTKKELKRAQVYSDRWKDQIPLVGFGPEAYSYSDKQQQMNKKYKDYLVSINKNEIPLDKKRIYKYIDEQKNLRRMVFNLKSNFQTEFNENQKQFFISLSDGGLGEISIEGENKIFRLNQKGLIVIEEIMRVLVDKSKKFGEQN